jgi:tetratricopeptide (TPR) repeat protein
VVGVLLTSDIARSEAQEPAPSDADSEFKVDPSRESKIAPMPPPKNSQWRTLDEALAAHSKARASNNLLTVVLRSMQSPHSFPQQVTKQHLETVEALIEEALKAAPDSAILLMNQADLRELQGRPDEAIAIYRKVIDRAPNDQSARAMAQNNLAFLLATTGQDLPLAMKLINQAITDVGELPELRDTRGLVHLYSGDLEQARADISAAIKSRPTSSMYFHLALVEERAGNMAAAQAAFAKAIEMKLDAFQLPPTERSTFRHFQVQVLREPQQKH